MNTRRIILISLFVLFVVGAAILIYVVFFRSITTPGQNTNQNVNGGTLPSTNINVNRPTGTNGNIPVSNTNGGTSISNINVSAVADGGVTKVNTVVAANTKNVTLSPNDDTLRYYDPVTGTFYETNQDGTNTRELASQLFPNAENITWSNDANKAVIEFPDGSSIVYDFNAQKQYTLSKDTEDYSFDPTGSQLAYKYVPENVEERYIVTSNIDGSNTKFIEAIGDEAANVDVSWSPKADVVATFRKSADSTSQEVYFIGLNQENFKSAITEGRGFTGKWSSTGEQMIYSVYSAGTNYNPELYIMNSSGDSIGSGRTDLGLQTWPDKCTFSGTTLYCAEPSFLSPGSGLYPDQAASSSDRFYQIDALTGTSRLIANPNISVSAKNLYVSSDGKRLFFTNSRTGALESILLS
jgi:hypothetical protein